MKQQFKIKKSFYKLAYLLLTSCFLVACNDNDVDDAYGKIKYNLELTANAQEIVLNENTPDDIALTLEWTSAFDHGEEYVTTYVYTADLVGKKPTGAGSSIKEYEDDGNFKRSYTHKELQELLVDNWKQLTGTTASVSFSAEASFDGTRLTIPETGTITVKIRTYGPAQFLADQLYMSGTAVGENDIEIAKSASNENLFVYKGHLSAGTINFPIIYGADSKLNSISPTVAEQEITDDPMAVEIKDKASAGVWVVKEAGDYRVTVNFTNKTVTIVPAGDIIDVEKIYIAGSVVDSEIEVTQTLEDENIYAFRGELKAGSLYLPILFEGDKARSIVPKASGNHDIEDGSTVNFGQADTDDATSSNHWNIKTAGTYRIVVNIDTKMITIYSPTTDLHPKEVSWNNTVAGINPFVSKVEKLWIYGSYNKFAGDGSGFTGFNNKYMLNPSLASPYIFVYKGDKLPRETVVDEYDKTLSVTGAVKFCVSNIHNNVWAYGSTADSKRNEKNGYITTTSGQAFSLVAGQGDNRYAYFLIPENTNYVVVDIQNLTVVFGNK